LFKLIRELTKQTEKNVYLWEKFEKYKWYLLGFVYLKSLE